MYIIKLDNGPSAIFKITNVKTHANIKKRADPIL